MRIKTRFSFHPKTKPKKYIQLIVRGPDGYVYSAEVTDKEISELDTKFDIPDGSILLVSEAYNV